MSSRLVARRLPPERLEQAFALVRALDPALAIEQWRDFARRAGEATPDEAGVVVLETPEGYLHGLFSWRRVDRLLEGPTLVVENLVTADFGIGSRTTCHLAAAMEALASKAGGRSLHVEVGRRRPSRAVGLRQAARLSRGCTAGAGG
ncbi:MAG: hypothetical protein FJX53_07205 [Alphaproteobacteria bacterium]|nr:hypothetical protein [Alphaproteobacteria bacterium]